MSSEPITAEWLSACDFKWRQNERQPNRHWSLKLNVPDDTHGLLDVSIEVQRCGWENQDGEYIGDPERWTLWVTDTFDRTAFLGNVRWQKEIVGLAELITHRPWNPKAHIYGQAWPEDSKVIKEAAKAHQTP